ncbi:2122_t:CDS:2, partial [Dentiscutata heterogama]
MSKKHAEAPESIKACKFIWKPSGRCRCNVGVSADTVPNDMSWFTTVKTKVVGATSFLLLLRQWLESYGVYLHGHSDRGC